ncbi:helix-turn-helix domain-containing protein [Buttiauxella noackiae]|uniref:helix-turn-helix domain-containing protein n=1 Tax=Buttiauxella noackiae TaxID=82992 RepID=UPI0035A578D9
MTLMAKAMGVKVGNSLRKLVLLKLADNANDQGECWPSVAYISDQCEMSERSVQNHIAQLAEDGFLWVEERRQTGAKNLTNVYHLTIDSGVANRLEQGANAAPTLGASAAESGANAAPTLGANAAPGTSHSFEPVIEPETPNSAGVNFISPAARKHLVLPVDGKIPFPPKFSPNQAHRQLAKERGADVEMELASFRDHYTARGTYLLDWNAAFNVWLRNSRPAQQRGARVRSMALTPATSDIPPGFRG